MNKLISYNPHNGSVVGEKEISTQKDIDIALKKAKNVFSTWKNFSLSKRIEYVKKFRNLLYQNKEKFAQLTTQEMGKPLKQSYDDVDSELNFIDWYIENAKQALSEKIIKETETAIYKIKYEPYGVCASIAP